MVSTQTLQTSKPPEGLTLTDAHSAMWTGQDDRPLWIVALRIAIPKIPLPPQPPLAVVRHHTARRLHTQANADRDRQSLPLYSYSQPAGGQRGGANVEHVELRPGHGTFHPLRYLCVDRCATFGRDMVQEPAEPVPQVGTNGLPLSSQNGCCGTGAPRQDIPEY